MTKKKKSSKAVRIISTQNLIQRRVAMFLVVVAITVAGVWYLNAAHAQSTGFLHAYWMKQSDFSWGSGLPIRERYGGNENKASNKINFIDNTIPLTVKLPSRQMLDEVYRDRYGQNAALPARAHLDLALTGNYIYDGNLNCLAGRHCKVMISEQPQYPENFWVLQACVDLEDSDFGTTFTPIQPKIRVNENVNVIDNQNRITGVASQGVVRHGSCDQTIDIAHDVYTNAGSGGTGIPRNDSLISYQEGVLGTSISSNGTNATGDPGDPMNNTAGSSRGNATGATGGGVSSTDSPSSGSSSAATTQSQTKNNIPTAVNQGAAEQTTIDPSPFHDGVDFARGADSDSLAESNVQVERSSPVIRSIIIGISALIFVLSTAVLLKLIKRR